MNEERMEKAIMENHYEVYRTIARLCDGRHGRSTAYEWTLAPPGNAYPNFIFNERAEAIDTETLRRQVKEKVVPPVWISSNPRLEPRIAPAGFRLIRVWKGMAMGPEELIRPPEPDSLEWAPVKHDGELDTWTEIVAESFDTPVEPGYFNPLIGKDKLELFLISRDGKPVATTLNFYQGDTVGVYMVATRAACRKQGIGQWAFYRSLRAAFDKGARLAVCSAMPDGVNAWQKIGFKIYTNLYLYWLVGKEFI